MVYSPESVLGRRTLSGVDLVELGHTVWSLRENYTDRSIYFKSFR